MPEPQPHTSGELAGDSEAAPRIEPAGLADEMFAANIREARERLKMSQGELARQMAERGFPYYQQTVRRIEEGRRKVSVGEAKALAGIMRTTMDRLTWPSREASAVGLLDMAAGRADSAWEQVAAWTASLLWSQGQLGTRLADAEKGDYLGSPRFRELAEGWRMTLGMTPEGAVETGRKDYARMREEGDDPYEDEDQAAEGGAS